VERNYGEATMRRQAVNQMVVEELVVHLDEHEVEPWLECEERVWTGFLAGQPGFVRKEVWENADAPGEVHIMIWWASREDWKRITAEQCDEVDARMGEWLRPLKCVEHNVIAGPVSPR
jgi:uncharacterized protein (TIGR03792 family)